MSTNSYNNKINTVVMLIVILIALKINDWFPAIEKSTIVIVVTLATAKSIYELMLQAILFLVENSRFLMRLYWGRLYLDGYWSYSYTANKKKHIGCLYVKQDSTQTKIFGTGLDDNYFPRSVIKSITSLIEENGVHYILDERIGISANSVDNSASRSLPEYHKVTYLFDKKKFFEESIQNRILIEVFGGANNGIIYSDAIIIKHKNAKNMNDVIVELKEKDQKRDTDAQTIS